MTKHKTVLLLGLSHSGKSSTGVILAEYLKYLFYDTDSLIQNITGLTARQLYVQRGKDVFYCTEKDTFTQCLNYPAEGAVISTGGGFCDNPFVNRLVKPISLRFFLYAEETVLFKRLTDDAEKTGHYPAFLQMLPISAQIKAQSLFSALYKRRNALYSSLSSSIINTSGLNCCEIAESIAKTVGNL